MRKYFSFLIIIINTILFGVSTQALNANSEIQEIENKIFFKYGFGNWKVNQSFSSTGLVEIKNTRIDDCFHAKPKRNADEQLYIQIIDDQVAVISSNSNKYKSYSEVKVGDSLKDVLKKNNNEKYEKILNPYGDLKNEYALFYWQDKAKLKGVRYDIENKKVILISVGNENLTLMEGCA